MKLCENVPLVSRCPLLLAMTAPKHHYCCICILTYFFFSKIKINKTNKSPLTLSEALKIRERDTQTPPKNEEPKSFYGLI